MKRAIMLGLALGVFIGFMFPMNSSPQEHETYVAANQQELTQAIALAGGGDTIKIVGEWNTSLKFGKLKYPDGQPLLVTGENTTVLHNGLSVMDCHNITISNFLIDGGTGTAGAELNDSYPDFGLKNITFEKLRIIPPAGPRGIFAGGHVMSGIKIKKSIIIGPIDGTHGIYFSGGAFDENYPAIQDVVIRGCTIELQVAGRNSIQFNGKYKDGLIVDNILRHAHLNAITLIGCQDFTVKNNIMYGCERGTGVVIYDYASHWGPYYDYFKTQADIDLFNARHWPNQRILVEFNTMVVGPKAFCNWPGNNEDPTANHPVVLINNAVNSGFLMWVPDGNGSGQNVQHPGWDYPSKDFWIRNNIFYSPSLNMIDIYHDHEAEATAVIDNIYWSTANGLPTIDRVDKLKTISGMYLMDPGFRSPVYEFVDTVTQPNYDWTTFETRFDAFSLPGYRRKIGKKFPVPVLGQDFTIDPIQVRMMEHADPVEDHQ